MVRMNVGFCLFRSFADITAVVKEPKVNTVATGDFTTQETRRPSH